MTNELTPVEVDTLEPTGDVPGIIATLGDLKPGAVITEAGLAYLFHRHVASVKRAVQRGELPPPCRLFGQPTWTVGTLLRHLEGRLDQAAKEAERAAQRLARLSP